jgi:hypothetical protein
VNLLGWWGKMRAKEVLAEKKADEVPEAIVHTKKVYELEDPCSQCGHSPCQLGMGSFPISRRERMNIAGAHKICSACGFHELRPFAQAQIEEATLLRKAAEEQEARNCARVLLRTPGRGSAPYRAAQKKYLEACDVSQLDPQTILSEEAAKLRGTSVV